MIQRAVAGLALWGSLSLLVAASPLHALDDQSTTSTLRWKLATLRDDYAQSFRWSRALREGHTTPTLALATQSLEGTDLAGSLAALLALQESATTTTVPLDRLIALRDQARNLPYRVPDLAWPAQPLLDAAERLDAPTPSDWLPKDLLEQLAPDDIAGNAEAASEIFAVGLREDPDRFFPPLIARWERFEASMAKGAQAESIVATLVLSRAASDTPPPPDEEWRRTAERLARGAARRPAPLGFQDRHAVERIAAWAILKAEDWSEEQFESDVQDVNKWLGWRFLEQESPFPDDALRHLIKEEDASSTIRFRAALLWLERSPWTLVETSNSPLFADAVADGNWRNWALAGLLAPGQDTGDSDSLRPPRTTLTPPGSELLDIRGLLLEALRDRLATEGNTDAQIALWEFLQAARDDLATDEISHAAIANLVDDDEWGNASAATWALDRLGARAVPAAIAGLNVSAELNDWQMASRCFHHLREYDLSFEASDYPEVMALMAEQLADDSIEGNAMAAMEYLEACGSDARPFLDDLIEHGDTQERRIAERLRDEAGDD